MIKKTYVIVLISVLCLMVSIEPVSAEHEWDHRYTISGVLTGLDGEVIRGSEVMIDCSEGQTDPSLCGHNEERSDSSDPSGKYSVVLHIHSSDNGKNITLTVEGESFGHIINLTGADGEMEEGDRSVTMDIQLSKNISQFEYWIPFIIIGIMVSTVVVMILKKKNIGFFKEKSSRVNDRRKDSNKVDCPKCDARLNPFNLERHLKSVHSMKSEDITILLGKNDNDAK